MILRVLIALIALIAPVIARTGAAADLATELPTVLDRTLAENPQAPGIVVHVCCPALALDWTGTAG